MKIIELVNQMLAQYEAEKEKANAAADEALKFRRIDPLDIKRKIHFDHMHMDACIAGGKVEAAKEILAALKEIE